MRRDVVEQERLNDLLRELAAHDARAEPSARVERAVMNRRGERFATRRSAVAAQQPALPDHRPGWLPARVSLGVAGAAAALLLVAWAGTRPVEPTGTVEPTRQGTSAVVQADSIPPVAPAEEPLPANSEEQPSPTAPSSVAPARAGIQPVAGEVEPFVRLLPMMEQELGTIRLARVRLPDQAVRTLGLDARAPLPGVDGFVEADVLLGEDGLARAIRFVR